MCLTTNNNMYYQWRGLAFKPKVWDFFLTLRLEKLWAVLLWSPLKNTQTVGNTEKKIN